MLSLALLLGCYGRVGVGFVGGGIVADERWVFVLRSGKWEKENLKSEKGKRKVSPHWHLKCESAVQLGWCLGVALKY